MSVNLINEEDSNAIPTVQPIWSQKDNVWCFTMCSETICTANPNPFWHVIHFYIFTSSPRRVYCYASGEPPPPSQARASSVIIKFTALVQPLSFPPSTIIISPGIITISLAISFSGGGGGDNSWGGSCCWQRTLTPFLSRPCQSQNMPSHAMTSNTMPTIPYQANHAKPYHATACPCHAMLNLTQYPIISFKAVIGEGK